MEKYKKVILSYNPRSGNGMFKNNLDQIIARCLEKNLWVIPVRASEGGGIDRFLSMLDPETYQDEYAMIMVSGGDGSINICVNAMLKHNIDLPLALLPAGTANDFAFSFEIPSDLDGMLDIALGGHYIDTDVGIVNGKYFINVAAIGQVVGVSQKTNPALKNSIGVLAYYLKAVQEVPTLRPISVRLTTEDKVIEEKMYFMVVMNGKSAGGFRKVSPTSEVNDGLLDVLLFRDIKVLQMPTLFFNVLKGKHPYSKQVLHLQTKQLLLESEVDLPTDIDGEHGQTLPLEFGILPGKIRIATLEEKLGMPLEGEDQESPQEEGSED